MENKIKKLDKKYTETKRKKIIIYKIIAVALAAIVVFGLTNANMPQANERSIVTMMAIDTHEDGVLVSTHMLVATPGIMENEFRQDLAEASGRNIFEAISKLNIAKGRKAEFSQCGLVVFGSELAQEGILEHTKALLASNTVSGGTLLLTTDGTGKDFLESAGLLGEQTSETLSKFITRFQDTLDMPMLVLSSYLSSELSESGASFMPILKFSNEEKNEEELRDEDELDEESEDKGNAGCKSKEEGTDDVLFSESNENENLEEENGKDYDLSSESNKEEEMYDENTQEDSENNEANDKKEEEEVDESLDNDNPDDSDNDEADIKSVGTVAIFKGGKREGYLNEQQTRGLNLIQNESRRGRYIVDGFTFDNQEYSAILGQVRSKSVRIKTDFNSGKPYIEYSINATIDITKNHELTYLLSINPLSKTDLYRNIEKAFQKAIIQDVKSAISVSQELNADFMQIQYRFWRKNHKEMSIYLNNNINEENTFLQNLTTTINANIRVR
ncbi:MAG: Ger(x)C family spore germination C-terminal domain-containing protein [Firmicutes bacterium]|nr:Ger(x)C family spore germination C-terminal domain-containing protein [Bacillota bacterium]